MSVVPFERATTGEPEADDAERAVLGAAMLWPDALQAAQDGVQSDYFRRQAHRLVWEAIAALASTGSVIDLLTVKEQLSRANRLEDVGGPTELARYVDGIPRRTNVGHYCGLIREAYRARKLQALASWLHAQAKAEQDAVDDLIGRVDAKLREMGAGPGRSALIEPPEIAGRVEQRIRLATDYGNVTGISTGFADVDHVTTGWQPGELVILAGRPGMGKTSFAGATAWFAATHGTPTLFVSVEMTADDIALRLACIDARLNFQRARSGHLNGTDWSRLNETISRIESSVLYLDDAARTTFDIRRQARMVATKAQRCGLVVVDYLQLLQPVQDGSRNSSEGRVRELGQMTMDLKALAKELACPVIVLSQLSRKCEEREDKRPLLSDLRESGAIEQDADFVGFLYQPARYDKSLDPAVAELIIAKQRNGPVCSQDLRWTGEYMRYDSVER